MLRGGDQVRQSEPSVLLRQIDRVTAANEPSFIFEQHLHFHHIHMFRLLLPAGSKILHLHFSSHHLPLTAQRTARMSHVGVALAIGSHVNNIMIIIIQKYHLYLSVKF